MPARMCVTERERDRKRLNMHLGIFVGTYKCILAHALAISLPCKDIKDLFSDVMKSGRILFATKLCLAQWTSG